MTTNHMQNFVDAIRSGTKLNSPIDDAVDDQSMVHYANISYRADIPFKINVENGEKQTIERPTNIGLENMRKVGEINYV